MYLYSFSYKYTLFCTLFFFKLNISWRSFHIWFVALCIQPHSIPLDHDLCSIDGHFGCFQYFLQIILHLLTLYIYLLHMYRYIFKRNSQMRNYRKKKYDTWYVFMHVANSAPWDLCQPSLPPEMCESGLYNTISYRGHCQKFWSFIFQRVNYNSM